MKVFKFGGASVNSATAIQNVASILETYREETPVVVFSAMGKTTNALEDVAEAAFFRKGEFEEKLKVFVHFHRAIIDSLFQSEAEPALNHLDKAAETIRHLSAAIDCDFDEFYDRIVPFGEWLSTRIISLYLKYEGTSNTLIDAGELIKTNDRFRDASPDWQKSCEQIQMLCTAARQKNPDGILITQGFIGQSLSGKPVTLGREGSDFTAAMLAYCLDAEQMVVWKDVEGLLNADPVFFGDTRCIPRLSYREAIELSFFGAKILHPKTIKPLQNKSIPLYIKSFSNPGAPGSLIHESKDADHLIPFLILKQDQVLMSFSSRDFSFIAEDKLQRLFGAFNRFNIRVNLMQNSAISFSVCINHPKEKLSALIDDLNPEFYIRYNEGLELLTIRHFTDEVIDQYLGDRTILIEQRSRRTFQAVYHT